MTPEMSDRARRVVEALERAAHRARQTAARTQTRLVVVRDGALVAERVVPDPPEAPGPASTSGPD